MRNHKEPVWLCLFLLLAAGIMSCSPAVATVYVEAPAAEAPPVQAEVAQPEVAEAPAEEKPAAQAEVASVPGQAGVNDIIIPELLPKPNRLIIKNGEMKLEVENTDVAIDRVTQIAADLGGYVISSQTRFSMVHGVNYKYASLTLGVPSKDFETALRRLREIAVRVLNESSSGEDVTDEYVDQESRLENLKATRDRIREFLDQAKTVEEALKVNQQLKEVENEIEQVQGRMNYLFDRAAYSTIAINLEPLIPPAEPTLTPTITVTPTPWPTLTPTPWTPGETFRDASSTLGNLFRGAVDFLIYTGVVCVPFLIPLGLLIWLAIWLRRKFPRKPKVITRLPTPPSDQAPKSE